MAPGGKAVPGVPRHATPFDVAAPELYNLADDLGETRNLARQYPEKVRELRAVAAGAKQGAQPA